MGEGRPLPPCTNLQSVWSGPPPQKNGKTGKGPDTNACQILWKKTGFQIFYDWPKTIPPIYLFCDWLLTVILSINFRPTFWLALKTRYHCCWQNAWQVMQIILIGGGWHFVKQLYQALFFSFSSLSAWKKSKRLITG